MRKFIWSLALAVLGLPVVTPAATILTWNGSTNTNFENNANWVGGSAPANDSTTNEAWFNTPGPGGVFQPTLTISRNVTRLVLFTAGWTLSGSGLSLGVNQSNCVYSSGTGINTVVPSINMGAGAGGITVQANNTLRLISGIASGNNGLSLVGGGTLLMDAASTYTGMTGIGVKFVAANSSGSATGTGEVQLLNGAGSILAGNGFIVTGPASGSPLNRGVLVGYNGFGSGAIAPSSADGTGIGTLSIDTSAIHFANNGQLLINLDGAQSSTLSITGDLDLSTAADVLTINAINPPTLNYYVLATYTGTLTGVFNTINIPAGKELKYVTFGGAGGEILLVPEPASLSLLALGGLALLRRRK